MHLRGRIHHFVCGIQIFTCAWDSNVEIKSVCGRMFFCLLAYATINKEERRGSWRDITYPLIPAPGACCLNMAVVIQRRSRRRKPLCKRLLTLQALGWTRRTNTLSYSMCKTWTFSRKSLVSHLDFHVQHLSYTR